MTFEQLVQKYLYLHKKLSLNLFGTFALEGILPDNEFVKKEKMIAVEGLQFRFEPNIPTDRGFIEFYAAEKKRILPLAESDVDTQLGMAKQIVNIGNPLDLPGIGKIVKQNNGTLILQPGYYAPMPEDGTPAPAPLRERATIRHQSGMQQALGGEAGTGPGSTLPWAKIALAAGVLVLAAAGIWLFAKYALPALMPGDSQKQETPIAATPVPADSFTAQVDSLNTPADSVAVVTTDSLTPVNWKANIRRFTDSAKAGAVLKKYQSYNIDAQMEARDSGFVVFVPIASALRDTAFKRDSLARFFAAKVWLEKM